MTWIRNSGGHQIRRVPAVVTDNSFLATQAAALSSNTWADISAGMGGLTWANFKSPSGEDNSTLDFANNALHNPIAKKIGFLGGAHPGQNNFLEYDIATNLWANQTPQQVLSLCHAWDNQTVDFATGDYYWYAKTTGTFFKFTSLTRTWSQIATNSGMASEETIGLCWDETRQGLISWNDTTGCDFWPKGSGSWTNIGTPSGLAGSFDMTAHYNRSTGDIWLGDGNNSPNQLWKLSQAGAFTKMAATPVSVECAGSAGNLSCYCSAAGKFWWINPRTGVNQMRSYSFAGDTWTTITPSNGAIALNDSSAVSSFVCDVASYGILLFIVGTSTGNAPHAVIYKP